MYPSDSIDSGIDNGVEIVAVGGEGVLDVENNTGRSAGENSAVRILRLDGPSHITAAVEVDHGWQITGDRSHGPSACRCLPSCGMARWFG